MRKGSDSQNGSRKRIALRRPRSGRRACARTQPSARCVDGLVNDVDHGVGTRDEPPVTGFDVRDVRTRVGRHLLLK